jgi:hypothetical protein
MSIHVRNTPNTGHKFNGYGACSEVPIADARTAAKHVSDWTEFRGSGDQRTASLQVLRYRRFFATSASFAMVFMLRAEPLRAIGILSLDFPMPLA